MRRLLLLTLALGTAAALHAQSAGQTARQSAERQPAGTYSLLYSFQCVTDGAYPENGLVRDSSGNLYGTTNAGGGSDAYGTVFQVTPGGAETVLHSFAGSPSDGAYPQFGSLTLDAAGNLYGTTYSGGEFGWGAVYKLTPTGTETVLYSFCANSSNGCPDGSEPYGGMALDSAGNLYGTAYSGGTQRAGVVFKLTPRGTESVLHDFGAFGDGSSPTGNLTRDASGNLYGTTGGASGTVFKVTATGTESVLYTFEGYPDGAAPVGGGLLRNRAGDLYGVTSREGADGHGVVFRVTPEGTESVLLSFNGTGGGYPIDGLAGDAAGNLYGTTLNGGGGGCLADGCGVLFELTKAGREVVLHDFSVTSTRDGGNPDGGVVRDPSGTLYGTLSNGGAHGCGAVFKFTP